MIPAKFDVDVVVLGAGPAGLAAACECVERGLSYVVLDRRGLGQSFHEYPHGLRFFSPPDEMEIGGVPLPVAGGEKPTREQYLAYLRAVVRMRTINLSTWEEVITVKERAGNYLLTTRRQPGSLSGRTIACRGLVVASGVWGAPIHLDAPGHDGPHVFNEFTEPTPFCSQPVLVVGGGNSALGAALSLMEARAEVALSMRRPPMDYRCGVRPYVKRNLDFAVEEKKIQLHANTVVREIGADYAVLQPVEYTGSEKLAEGMASDYRAVGEAYRIDCRFVFALLGHRPETSWIHGVLGLDQHSNGRPVCDLRNWRTQRPRMVVAGSLAHSSIDILLRIRDQARKAVESLAAELG